MNQTHLAGANLSNAHMVKVDLRGANLSESDLSKSYLPLADLREASLDGADLHEAHGRAVKFGRAYLTEADLTRVGLENADMREASLYGAVLYDAHLYEADLSSADLGDTDLRGANLNFAHLFKTNFRGSNLTGADLKRVDQRETRTGEASAPWEIFSLDFTKASLEETDLQDADLSGVQLQSCSLKEADLRRTDFSSAKNILVNQLAGSNLTGAILPEGTVRERVESTVRSASHARKLFTPIILASFVLPLVAMLMQLDKSIVIKLVPLEVSINSKYFALGMPLGVLALFAYFLHYMGRLWENLADLPAWFPDGAAIYRYPDPWFPINFTRAHLKWLKDQPGGGRAKFAFLLIWLVAPLALAVATLGFWCKLKDAWVLAGNFSVFVLACGVASLNYQEARKTLQTLGREHAAIEGEGWLWGAITIAAWFSAFLVGKAALA